jgi:hypothetical protein
VLVAVAVVDREDLDAQVRRPSDWRGVPIASLTHAQVFLAGDLGDGARQLVTRRGRVADRAN